MTETSLSMVRQLLVDSYGEIKRRLTLRLGSTDLASDALQDAWLRIARLETLGSVQNPTNYIVAVAMNAARDRMRGASARYLSGAEVENLLEIPDEAPDPERTAKDRSDLRVLESILLELPERQREILLAARLDNMPRQEIARRFGISRRLVEKELQRAQEFCLARRERMRR